MKTVAPQFCAACGRQSVRGIFALKTSTANKAKESISEILILYLWWLRDISVQIYDFFEVCGRLLGIRVGVNPILGRSKGIDDNYLFQCKFFSSHSFGRFVCVRVGVAWRNKLVKIRNINLKSYPFSSYSFRDHNVHTHRRPASGRTDMARSTRLVILFRNTWTLWGRKRFLLHATYFSPNSIYPFTLRVTVINIIFFGQILIHVLTYLLNSIRNKNCKAIQKCNPKNVFGL